MNKKKKNKKRSMKNNKRKRKATRIKIGRGRELRRGEEERKLEKEEEEFEMVGRKYNQHHDKSFIAKHKLLYSITNAIVFSISTSMSLLSFRSAQSCYSFSI